MRTIIAGSRTGTRENVNRAMAIYGLIPDVVVSGMAPGIDRAGVHWAIDHGIPYEPYPADWVKHGRAAGPLRNRLMASKASALVAIWDGTSPGTRDMISVSFQFSFRPFVYVYPIDQFFWLDSKEKFRAMRAALSGKRLGS